MRAFMGVFGTCMGMMIMELGLQAMMDSNGDAIDWPCYIAPATYIISAIFVMTVSVLVSFLFSRRIKRIDMVEVLKGMEKGVLMTELKCEDVQTTAIAASSFSVTREIQFAFSSKVLPD